MKYLNHFAIAISLLGGATAQAQHRPRRPVSPPAGGPPTVIIERREVRRENPDRRDRNRDYTPRGPSLAFSIGPSFAEKPDQFKNESNTGFNAGVGLTTHIGGPLSFRLRYDYNHFNRSDGNASGANTPYALQPTAMHSGTGDMVIGIPFRISVLSPYAFVGGGIARVERDVSTSAASVLLGNSTSNETALAWDAGVGFKALLSPAAAVFVEGSYYSVYTSDRIRRFVPVRAGLALYSWNGRNRRGSR